MGVQTALPFNDGLTIYLPLVKIDRERRLITGVATSEMRDSDGEIIDFEASKEAFRKWAGNIREMHDPHKAVGKRVEILPDEKHKKIYVTSRISEGAPETWAKVLDGTLTGYSVGGRVLLKEVDKNDPATKRIKEFTMSELSVVDAPSNPECVMGLVKSVGGVLRYVEQDNGESLVEKVKKFKERRKRQMEDQALKKTAKEAAEKEAAEKEEAKKEEACKEEAKKVDGSESQGGVEERIAKLEAALASLTEAVKELIATDEAVHDQMDEKDEAKKEDAEASEEAEEDAEEAEEEEKEEGKKSAGSDDDLQKSIASLKEQNKELAKSMSALTENFKKFASRPRLRKFIPEKQFASDQAEELQKSEKAAAQAKANEPIPPEIQSIIEKSKSGTATPSELRQKDDYLAKRMGARFGNGQ